MDLRSRQRQTNFHRNIAPFHRLIVDAQLTIGVASLRIDISLLGYKSYMFLAARYGFDGMEQGNLFGEVVHSNISLRKPELAMAVTSPHKYLGGCWLFLPLDHNNDFIV
jgi:hypothetical protein